MLNAYTEIRRGRHDCESSLQLLFSFFPTRTGNSFCRMYSQEQAEVQRFSDRKVPQPSLSCKPKAFRILGKSLSREL